MAESRQRTAWADHEREQLRAWSRLTYRQRLDWLWQAKLFAQRAQAAAAARAHSPAALRGAR